MIVFLSFFYNLQILEIREIFIYTNEKKFNIHHFIYIYIYKTYFFFFKFKNCLNIYIQYYKFKFLKINNKKLFRSS